MTGAGGAVSGTGTLAIRLRGDADGEVRIVGAYPPPLVPAVPADLDALLARPPRVTRYGRHRRRRPRTAVAWSATSVVLAAAGMGLFVFAPSSPPIRCTASSRLPSSSRRSSRPGQPPPL